MNALASCSSQGRSGEVGEVIPITSTYCLVYHYWCIIAWYNFIGKTIVAQMVKYLPAMREPRVQSLGQEDHLEKGMANHSSILAWRIPWTEEPSGLQSMGLQRVGYD